MKQIDKISLVIDYIEQNLTKKIELDMVADAVHYSKYYLHRSFKNTLGMTMHDYIQRRQLTEAAKLLVFSQRPILEIALLSGYESQQAFHSMFKSMYKLPPKRYRENERFYPLQLKYEFEGSFKMLKEKIGGQNIIYATNEDIPSWMNLVKLVVDGYPLFNESDYISVLKERIKLKQALILKDEEIAVGAMLFSNKTGSIDFLGTHPLYRQKGIPQAFLKKVMEELLTEKNLNITTYRQGDKADTGQRKEIMELGFAERELLIEYGYPTQRFELLRGKTNE